MDYRRFCWYICHKWFFGLPLRWCWHLQGCNHWVQPHKHPLCGQWLRVPPSLCRCEADKGKGPSEVMGDGGLTWWLQVMMQRDTVCFSKNPLKILPQQGSLSWRADESLMRSGVCLHLSIHCSAVDICWAAGHRCP